MTPYLCSRSACDIYVNTPQRYCESHRCTADACQNAKRSASRFCTDHMKCLKTGCSTPRYYPDSDEQSSPFCAEHWWSCRDFDCTAWANYSANSPFCTAHGCQFPTCRNPVSTGIQSCATHACTFAQCLEPIREGLRACLNHACQNPGCQYPVSDGRTACAAHICRIIATTCNEMGADYHQGRYYCIAHTCNASGCLEPTLNAGATPEQTFTMCTRHRCAAQQCPHTRRENSNYCHNHTLCGKSGCEAVKNIVDRFCAAHINTCIHPSCPNTRKEYGHYEWFDPGIFRSWRSYYIRDGFREHCSKHECVAPDCVSIQEYAQGRKYCHQHEACGKLDCGYSRLINERFCSHHQSSCRELDCSSYLYQPSEYCTNHACAMVGNGCTLRRQENRTLCDQHRTCAAPGCTTVCTSPQVACEHHTCYVKSCERAVCNLDCRYCQDRKLKKISYTLLTRCLCAIDVCARDGCFDPQDRVFDYSATHTFCSNHKPMPRPHRIGMGDSSASASGKSMPKETHIDTGSLYNRTGRTDVEDAGTDMTEPDDHEESDVDSDAETIDEGQFELPEDL
jgi:hypothetical protein